jgi:hypothetical protein
MHSLKSGLSSPFEGDSREAARGVGRFVSHF